MCSEQLRTWGAEFGGDYHGRNYRAGLKQRIRLWAQILGHIEPESILEVGAGTGTNLIALSHISDAELLAVEPNSQARMAIPERDSYGRGIGAIGGDASGIPVAGTVELVFTSGVLIHIPPDELDAALDEIYRVSSRYIACIEYFSDQLEAKTYRGEEGLLWTRDFGSYWMDRFPDLGVVRCGFAWKRTTGLDNLTYWLFEKR